MSQAKSLQTCLKLFLKILVSVVLPGNTSKMSTKSSNEFNMQEVPFADVVGHLCTYERCLPDTACIQKIVDWPICKSLEKFKVFLGQLGLSGYLSKTML